MPCSGVARSWAPSCGHSKLALQIFTALDRGRESANFDGGGLPHRQPRSHPLQEVCCSSALRSSSSACRVVPLQRLHWQRCLLSLQGSAARPLVRMAGGVFLAHPAGGWRQRREGRGISFHMSVQLWRFKKVSAQREQELHSHRLWGLGEDWSSGPDCNLRKDISPFCASVSSPDHGGKS